MCRPLVNGDALCDHSHCPDIPVDEELHRKPRRGCHTTTRPLFWRRTPPPPAFFLTIQHCHMGEGVPHTRCNSIVPCGEQG